MTERKKLKIGLFGFGCVGYGLYQVLERSEGFKANIKTICVKNRSKQRPISEAHFTFDPDEILNDSEINVVVELIDDADAAFLIVQKALRNGKSVVTANKKMLAEHFKEILALQEETGQAVLYEAAACASIPIIRNLEEYYDNDFLKRIEGIVNGSTNYILTRSQNDGQSYKEALSIAQNLGYAESDPRLDVEGYDARNKLLILIAHAFGTIVKEEDILKVGINRIGELETRYAREKGLKIKLIAQAIKHEDTISALVCPQFISKDSPLFAVDDVYNGVITETAFADRQFFSGKGAGDFPTASAVLSDLSALSYSYRYEYKKIQRKHDLQMNTEQICEVFVRGKKPQENAVRSYFIAVQESYHSGNDMYIKGNIQLSKLNRLNIDFPELSFVLCNSLKENTSDLENLKLSLKSYQVEV